MLFFSGFVYQILRIPILKSVKYANLQSGTTESNSLRTVIFTYFDIKYSVVIFSPLFVVSHSVSEWNDELLKLLPPLL